jgi:hypothetical protein
VRRSFGFGRSRRPAEKPVSLLAEHLRVLEEVQGVGAGVEQCPVRCDRAFSQQSIAGLRSDDAQPGYRGGEVDDRLRRRGI